MSRTFKAALLAILGLASVTVTRAVTYNNDLIVGFTTSANGNDLIYDLGSEGSITNGQTWNLGAALSSANLSNSLSTVNWGVIGDANVSGTRTCWITLAPINEPANPVPDRTAFNAIDFATSKVFDNNFSAVGQGNYAIVPTQTAGPSVSWYQETVAVGGDYSSASQPPNSTGLVSADFWQQIATNAPPTKLGSFTLNSRGVLSYSTNMVSAASTNAYLTSLVLNPAGLTSTFVSNTFSYLATNAYGNTPTVTVVNADTTATNKLIYNNTTNTLTSGSASAGLVLTLGVTNLAKVQVTAQDGVTVYTYQVNIVEQPSQTVPTLTNSVSGGANLVLSWPADHLGYHLLTQTNNLNKGVSSNPSDWGTVAGSASITSTNIAIITATNNAYYRLVYP